MAGSSTWLLTGGAGYIGKHVARAMQEAGYRVVVLDDLSTGDPTGLPESVDVIVGSCANAQLVNGLLRKSKASGVIHLAAAKHARESVRDPMKYWDVNVRAILGVLQGLRCTAVTSFVLSSSCSVFGDVASADGDSPVQPLSPYARSKLVSEWMLKDVAPMLQTNWVSLRYFNVIGCDTFPGARDESQECLLPSMARSILQGSPPVVFGDDFPTRDGSAERDYIDVRDLAQAHVLAARALTDKDTLPLISEKCLNVGTGTPTSVFEVVGAIRSALGVDLPVLIEPRHPADPARVWAIPSPELTSLGWAPRYSLAESVTSHFQPSSFLGQTSH